MNTQTLHKPSLARERTPAGTISQILEYTENGLSDQAGIEKAGELSLQWAMLTGGGAMLGPIIAGGHPLTVLVALVMAPFTGLTPLIGVGFFTALTQVYMRPPRVQEMETLSEDIWQVKNWWKNRVTRVILCFLCPGIPAIIGKILAIFKICQAI